MQTTQRALTRDKRVILLFQGRDEIPMPLHQAVDFLESFGAAVEVLDGQGKTVVDRFEVDVLKASWENYAPSA